MLTFENTSTGADGGVDAALLIIRIALGVVMIAHGYNHIFRGGKIKGTAGWFESLGMKPGILHAWTASITELAAGAMLILGIATPLAAAGVVGVMLVAACVTTVGGPCVAKLHQVPPLASVVPAAFRARTCQ